MVLIRVTVLLLVFQCFSFLTSLQPERPCITPDRTISRCISLFECYISIKRLSTFHPDLIQYVKDSICLGYESGRFMVCCEGNVLNTSLPTDSNPPLTAVNIINTYVEVTNATNIENMSLLPGRKYCGYQHNDDRYFSDNATAIDEFPWLVHVKATLIKEEYKYGDRCSGVIINKRYILTDWTCGAKALKVRLGQYDTSKKVSCISYNPDVPECTEPTIEIMVEERVFLNDPTTGNYSYSLVLLRLEETITFTDFVRPICLPVGEIDKRDPEQMLTFSGWGVAWRDNPNIVVKKRLSYEMTDMNKCYDLEEQLNDLVKTLNVTIDCLAPHKNNTDLACNGDHGGPLMYHKKRKQWFLEGIIVKVYPIIFNSCKNNDFPASGIRITDYVMKWILSSIRR